MLETKLNPIPTLMAFEEGPFEHKFGGRSCHVGAIPEGHEIPLHLILTLDLSDPLVVFESTLEVSKVPLYYPLVYGYGGGEIQYEIVSDSEIKILNSFERMQPGDDCETAFQRKFSEQPVSLMPLNYREYRAAIMSEHGSNHYAEDEYQKEDRALLKTLSPHGSIRFGHRDGFSPIQGDISWPCANPKCDDNYQTTGRSYQVDVFAQVSDQLSDDISIWGSPGSNSHTEIYFGLIQCCRTVIAVNRCL